MNRGETPKERRLRIGLVALIYFVIAIFVMTLFKGSFIERKVVEEVIIPRNYYFPDPVTALSGILTGIVPFVLFHYAAKSKPNTLAICAVLLETAALLFVGDCLYFHFSDRFRPLSFVVLAGQAAAAVGAYHLYKLAAAASPPKTVFSKKEMGIACLLIALALGLSFVPGVERRYIDGMIDEHFNYSGYQFALPGFMLAICLNLTLAFAVGLLHGRPIFTGLLLLITAALPILSVVQNGYRQVCCWPIPLPEQGCVYYFTPLSFVISLLLLAIALRFWFGKLRKTTSTAKS